MLIDTKAYLLKLFLENFIFVFIFYMTNAKISKKMYWLMVLMVVIKFFLDIFIFFTEFIPIAFGYYILRKSKIDRVIALNKALLCTLCSFFIFIFSSTVLLSIISNQYSNLSYIFIFIQVILDYMLAGLFVYLYKRFNIETLIEKNSSNLTIFFVCMLLFSLVL